MKRGLGVMRESGVRERVLDKESEDLDSNSSSDLKHLA